MYSCGIAFIALAVAFAIMLVITIIVWVRYDSYCPSDYFPNDGGDAAATLSIVLTVLLFASLFGTGLGWGYQNKIYSYDLYPMYPIYSLNSELGVYGSFSLGSGTVESEIYYVVNTAEHGRSMELIRGNGVKCYKYGQLDDYFKEFLKDDHLCSIWKNNNWTKDLDKQNEGEVFYLKRSGEEYHTYLIIVPDTCIIDNTFSTSIGN